MQQVLAALGLNSGTGPQTAARLVQLALYGICLVAAANGVAIMAAQGTGLAGGLLLGGALVLGLGQVSLMDWACRHLDQEPGTLVGWLLGAGRLLGFSLLTAFSFVWFESLIASGMAGPKPAIIAGIALAAAILVNLAAHLLPTGRQFLVTADAAPPETVPAERIPALLAGMPDEKLPTRATFHDALIYMEGAFHLVVPVTGPHERARAKHVEDLITLACLLTANGLASPVTQGRQKARRQLNTGGGAWSLQERYKFHRLEQDVVSSLLSCL